MSVLSSSGIVILVTAFVEFAIDAPSSELCQNI